MGTLNQMLAQWLPKKSFEINLGQFSFSIYYYSLCIVSGMICAALCAIPMCKRRGIKIDYLVDILLAVIPCSIVCARLWYVIFDLKEFNSFWDVINTRSGGMAIQGGVLGGALGLWIVAKIHKIDLTRLFDLGASVLPLGQAIGRWGNFINQEVYGKPTSVTWFPFSVYIEATGQYHLACFFYEMVLDFILFVLIYTFLMKYQGKRGLYATSFYFIGYGVIRAVLEPLRDVSFQMGNLGFPVSVLISILFVIGGGALLAYLITKDVKDKNFWWKDYFKKKSVETAGVNSTETVETGTLTESEPFNETQNNNEENGDSSNETPKGE